MTKPVHSRSKKYHLTQFLGPAVGSSLARVTCETSQVLLAGGQVVFLGDLPFSPGTLRLTQLKMSEIILTGRKTQIKKKSRTHKLT